MSHVVVLDVYSGVPNPTWVIDDQEARELQRKVGSGRKGVGGSLPLLGYRGFILRPVECKHDAATALRGLAAHHSKSKDLVLSGVPEAEERARTKLLGRRYVDPEFVRRR